jgi:hypothetical protein
MIITGKYKFMVSLFSHYLLIKAIGCLKGVVIPKVSCS